MLNKERLRPWQISATHKALSWFLEEKQKHFLINAAPGAGKTICASFIAKSLIDLDEVERVIVIAPRSEVVSQWADKFKFVTDRYMIKITAAMAGIEGHGIDLCATWSAVQGLLEVFQKICNESKTLVICDEHHHAAVQAAWGTGAEGAFKNAEYVLVLSGTPVRDDGQETTWFAYDSQGKIDHPKQGTFTLTYGEAVDANYCRPITFHRHEGKFTVTLENNEDVAVSGSSEVKLKSEWKKIPGLQNALDFYRLAQTPKYLSDEKTPDPDSYQATMIKWGIEKLNTLRDLTPNAGGLVIAPSILVAEYMAKLLEKLDEEKPVIVHSNMAKPDEQIKAFKNTNKRWIVTVGMVSEGVDIKRLRVLIYLPNAQTELHFRQSMGRVVRTLEDNDISRAYVIMPKHKIFEEYARRVEREMPARFRKDHLVDNKIKICPECSAECDKTANECSECGHVFTKTKQKYKSCPECEALNTLSAKSCDNCGKKFGHNFTIGLDEALRLGAIIRGEDIDESDVREAEKIYPEIRKNALEANSAAFLKILQQVPEEMMTRFIKIVEESKKK